VSSEIDMTPKRPVLNMHNGLTNGKVHVYSYKQIPVDLDIIVSFGIQSGHVSEGGAISVWHHVNCLNVFTSHKSCFY